MSKTNPFDVNATNKDRERAEFIEYMFDRIETFALENDHFDTDFTESLREQYDKSGYLSEKQFNALENIYERWVNQ